MELERRSAELQQLSVELRESKRQLERIAYVDPLTGISNRRLFDMDMTHLTALARRGGGDFTLLLIDLDRFKDINDTLGHDAGDALLIEATRRLGMELRESDRIFRLGGDEFAALLMATSDTAGIEVVCQRLLQNLARPFAYRDRTVRPSASIGAAQWSADTPGPDALYKCADLALYEAKNAGRNTWRWHAVPAPTEPIANS
jgi:diguanylate cyclase (GGDEF)-like protein